MQIFPFFHKLTVSFFSEIVIFTINWQRLTDFKSLVRLQTELDTT